MLSVLTETIPGGQKKGKILITNCFRDKSFNYTDFYITC